MELNFSRDHVLQTAPTHPNTLAVFPTGRNKQQKVIVGDSDGSVQCFSFKPTRGNASSIASSGSNTASTSFNTRVRATELTPVFKHLPTGVAVQNITVPLSSLLLAASTSGASAPSAATVSQKDKAFIAVGNSVYGITKKGKEFFRFKTNVTESIGRILVHGIHLHTLSKYTYSHYKNCEDENYFLANDLVNDMTLITLSDANTTSPSGISKKAGNHGGIRSSSGMRGKDLKLLTVLGCQDGYIRAISGSNLYYEAALQGAVTVLNNDYVYSSMGGGGGSGAASTSGMVGSGNELIYGLDNGTIGQMLLTGDSIRRGWVVDGGSGGGGASADAVVAHSGSGTQRSQGSVKSILSKLDVTHDGVNDVVVGRDDGTMEVYGFNFNGDPELLYSRSVGETVHTIDGGFITSGETEEIIAQTYSGKVLCFHPNNTDYDMDSITSAQNEAKAAKKKEENEKVLEGLGREVKDLEKAVKKEQERFSRISNTFLQPIASFHVKDKFHLNPSDGSYVLQLETTVAVAMLTLQSQIQMEIEDVIAENSGSIQYSTATDASGAVNSYLMTYRASQPSKRIELKLWLSEGKEGKLQVFIIPDQKDTAGSVCTYNLMPLSLHKRMHNTVDRTERPLSELSLRGQFIIPEAHSWLAVCLPELPSTFNVDDDKIEYVFHCSSIDTLLECRVQAGNLSFRSDSIVTLMTVKNHLVADATAQHIKLNVHFSIHPDGLKHFCALIWPQLSYQSDLRRKMCMVDGILEIKRQEDNLSFLSQELHNVMNEADSIREDFSRQPRVLQRMRIVVVDTYVTWHKLKGGNVESSRKRVEDALDNVDSIDDLIELLEG